MQFKFNWGHGVSLFLGAFIIFILTFVYKTVVRPEYDHKLVSEEYYKDEIHFQQEIDRVNNALQLKQNVVLLKSDKGIHVVFPSIFDSEKVKGFVEIQRANDDKLDLKTEIVLNNMQMIIPADKLVKGSYNIKVVWDYDKMPFQLNQKFNY
jgi:hypothetical protein